MKCKGMVKEKLKNGKKIDKRCNTVLENNAIFCPECGEPTKALSTGLSAKENFSIVWKSFQEEKAKYYPFSIYILLTAYLAIILAVVFRYQIADFFNLPLYVSTNLVLLFLVPFTLVPFTMKGNFLINPFTISNYLESLKYYPRLWLITLANILFFLLLKILCTGYLLAVIVDPILHLVRLVLVLYWLAIMFPLSLVSFRKKVNPIKAAILCYQASAETRWQQFFLIMQIAFINLIGALLAGVGLLISIPLSYILIERYFHQMEDYDLFNYVDRDSI